MCRRLTIIIACIVGIQCYVNYEIFKGFDVSEQYVVDTTTRESSSLATSNPTNMTTSPQKTRSTDQIIKTTSLPSETLSEMIKNDSAILKAPKFNCPEEEKPTNIGPFEVPTQRDMVLLIRNTLIKMFNNYHEKALFLLKDIKEVTRSTSEIEKKCTGRSKDAYRRCVNHVKKESEFLTKELVTALENQRYEVISFINVPNETLCNISNMKADPVQLIKTLAMEEISLDFALPGFLRIVNACNTYCSTSSYHKINTRKPLRRMTDQDLVVRHLLTRKNYLDLVTVPRLLWPNKNKT